MQDLRSLMDLQLKAVVVPSLRLAGFKGSLPHFRRIGLDRIDLITFQFDRNGGGFVVEISQCEAGGITTHWGKKIEPKAMTAWDMHPDQRARLQPEPGGLDDYWFRFESGQITQCAQLVLQCLPSAEVWWQARATPNQSLEPTRVGKPPLAAQLHR